MRLCSFAGMLAFRVRFGEVGVVILQHPVLIAMAQLAVEGVVFGPLVDVGWHGVGFHCALGDSFVGLIVCRAVHVYASGDWMARHAARLAWLLRCARTARTLGFRYRRGRDTLVAPQVP